MCYSAQIWADYRKYQKTFGADLDIAAFVQLYWARQNGAKVKTPKAMDDALLESEAGELIRAYRGSQAMKLEQELFTQKKRLNDAVRTLQTKTTKKAQEDRRIATEKISKAELGMDDLRRAEPLPRDSRIFPGVYAPVLVVGDGRRVVKPMRYQCRPAGKPAKNDVLYPGTYNARRDSLGKYWKDLFGYSHGLVVANTFYENVEIDGENQRLQFTPKDGSDMLVACLWSHWTDPVGIPSPGRQMKCWSISHPKLSRIMRCKPRALRVREHQRAGARRPSTGAATVSPRY